MQHLTGDVQPDLHHLGCHQDCAASCVFVLLLSKFTAEPGFAVIAVASQETAVQQSYLHILANLTVQFLEQ